jgi:uncharacterized membrane protein
MVNIAEPPVMTRTRLEAFSDGVIAIAITIMVLELRVPHRAEWSALVELIPTFVGYVLSFLYIAIYWTNHHHMLHTVTRVNGKILWANLHLLFWLALIPFVSNWMDETGFAGPPVALYGVVLLMAAVAYYGLSRIIIRSQARMHQPALEEAIGHDWKGKVSIVIYLVAIALSFENRWIAIALYWVVAVLWFVPDRRIERHVEAHEAGAGSGVGAGAGSVGAGAGSG